MSNERTPYKADNKFISNIKVTASQETDCNYLDNPVIVFINKTPLYINFYCDQ